MPRKVFTAGEVLTAANVQTFLADQSVMTFASSAARGSAIPTPVEGMLTYLADTNTYETYDGAAFVELIDPDTLINPMTTLGDLITAGTAGVPTRIGIGASGEVLTVFNGAPAWAEAGGGGGTRTWTLLNGPSGTNMAGSTLVTVSGIGGYDNLIAVVYSNAPASFPEITLRINGNTSDFQTAGVGIAASSNSQTGGNTLNNHYQFGEGANTFIKITGASTTGAKSVEWFSGSANTPNLGGASRVVGGVWNNSASVSSIGINCSTGNFVSGTIFVYGA